MNRNTRSCSIKKFASGLISIFSVFATVFGQLAGTAPVVSPPQFQNGMRIDGYLQRQGSEGDWLAGPGGSNNIIFTDAGVPLVPLCVRIIDKYDSESDEVISKGNIQDDPNTMKWRLKRAMGKTDMNNILYFVALNPFDNHVWVVLGADRRTAGNNSSIDFEFLQNQVLMIGDISSSSNGGFISFGPHGGRTIGDFNISVSLQGGGFLSSISIRQWRPDAAGTYGYFDFVPPAGAAYVATNTTAINVPFGAFGSTTYPPLTFAEVAIDITAFSVKSVWVKSKNNDKLDDFNLPFQFTSSGFPISVNYTFYDLYHAQLNVDISPLNSNDFNFHWSPVGAYNGTAVDPSVTGSLNDYTIQNPIFTADTNYSCISYLYKVSTTRKDNGAFAGETYVVINSPCKIGKPINPDQMQQGEVLLEENISTDHELRVFPNPAKSSATVTLTGENSVKDIHLINMNGSTVQRWSGISTNTLQLKDLPSGIYLLKVFSRITGKTETKKIIVNN